MFGLKTKINFGQNQHSDIKQYFKSSDIPSWALLMYKLIHLNMLKLSDNLCIH